MTTRDTAEIVKKVRADLVKDQLMNELKALITDEVLVINQKNKPYIQIKKSNIRGKNENK
jgi:hypothetical protein